MYNNFAHNKIGTLDQILDYAFTIKANNLNVKRAFQKIGGIKNLLIQNESCIHLVDSEDVIQNFIFALKDFVNDVLFKSIERTIIANDSHQLIEYFRTNLNKQSDVEFWILYLAKDKTLLGYENLDVPQNGYLNINSSRLIQKAVCYKAQNLMFIYNCHDKFKLPSTSDYMHARVLRNKLKLCNIDLINYLLISNSEYYNFYTDKTPKTKRKQYA